MIRNAAFELSLFLAVVCCSDSSALEITIDPGDAGEMFTSRTFVFTELNGVTLLGQTLHVDFVFSDMKHVELHPPESFSGFLVNELTLFFSARSSPSQPLPTPTGWYSDSGGANIHDSVVGSASDDVFFALYRTSHNSSLEALPPFIHDVHMQVQLPSDPDAAIMMAQFSLTPSSHYANVYKVGTWVPEPSSLVALTSLATASLCFGSYRRRKRPTK